MRSKTSQIPLAELIAGERATLLYFAIQRAVTNRLAALGFTPGVEVDMLQNFGRGPLIVIVRGTRIALGRREAAGIIVQRGGE